MVRKVKVATISLACEFRKAKKREDTLNYIAKTVAKIAPIKPDIIALPEVFPVMGLEKEKKVLGPGKKLLQDLAKKYKSYLVGSLYEKIKGKIYNTALVANREGKIIGKYDKIHPTESELEKGIIPGRRGQLPIKTDFGKIGIQNKLCEELGIDYAIRIKENEKLRELVELYTKRPVGRPRKNKICKFPVSRCGGGEYSITLLELSHGE